MQFTNPAELVQDQSIQATQKMVKEVYQELLSSVPVNIAYQNCQAIFETRIQGFRKPWDHKGFQL